MGNKIEPESHSILVSEITARGAMSDVNAHNIRAHGISVKRLLKVVLELLLSPVSRKQMKHIHIVLGNGKLRASMDGRRRVIAGRNSGKAQHSLMNIRGGRERGPWNPDSQ
eukprot:507035-Pyramimonas_sp.AAC.1